MALNFDISINDTLDLHAGEPQRNKGLLTRYDSKQLPEIGGDAIWTVSSCKRGFGVANLRDNDNQTFWQSDGNQPHKITCQFR
jgi:hypothetical protein